MKRLSKYVVALILALTSVASAQNLTVSPRADYRQPPSFYTTFRAVDKGATTVGSGTAPFMVLQGSSTRTIKITRIRFSSTAATGTAADFWVSKFTTISGGTTRTAPTIAKADTKFGSAAATAVVSVYSAVPTTATQADGYWSATRYEVVTAAVTVLPQVVELEYGVGDFSTPLTLAGTGEYVGIGISAAGTTPVHDAVIEWVEINP